jgi:isopentenyl-diphosphate Delta-isomerase
MLIDTVDRSDKIVGQIEKQAALSAGVNFRVVHVLVFNHDGLLLMQQIPSGKRHSSMWGSSVAGYVYSGETYEQAAERRLAQELGLRSPISFVAKTKMRESSGDKFIAIFRTTQSGPLTINSSEISGIEWIRPDLVDHLVSSGVRQFTPTFLHVAKVFGSAGK